MLCTRNNDCTSHDGESSSTTGGSPSRNERQTNDKGQTDRTEDEQTGKKNMNRSFFFQFYLHCCILLFRQTFEKNNEPFILIFILFVIRLHLTFQ